MMTNFFKTTWAIAVLILTISAINSAAATFIVANTNDTGPGSLRDALTQANSNAQVDTINFDPAVFNVPRTITLTADLPITTDGAGSHSTPGRLLVINGPGPDFLTISGNNTVRIFYLSQYSNAVMSGMTLRNGVSVGSVATANEDGGAIHAQSSDLSLSNMVIRNNSATSRGGGIHLSSPKTTIITDSVITENSATSKGGGMIVVQGQASITMRNVVVSNNTTENEDAGVSIARGLVTIENCLFTGNRAGTASGGSNRVGALTLYQTPATVTNTIFSNNSSGLQGVNGSVGAVHAEGADMVFRRVTITGNKAQGNVGGIYIRTGATTITLIDSTISNNEAGFNFGPGPTFRGDGAGVLATGGPINIVNTTIANNLGARGSGIINYSDGLNIINSTIAGNTATDDRANHGGGGILNAGETGDVGVINILNSIVAGNTAPAGRGPDVTGPVVSGGYNIIGNTFSSSGFGATGDQLNIDPLLDPAGLADNGGPTLTIALQANSPAINSGTNAVLNAPLNITHDQRLFTRKAGSAVDIGAFEFGAIPVPRGDFNGDGFTDYLLFNSSNRRSAIWHLQESAFLSGVYGPTLPGGWALACVADIDVDGGRDFILFNASTRQTAIWYLNGAVLRSSAYGPTLPVGWTLIAAVDFNGDGGPDYVLFNPSARRSAIWFLNGTTLAGSAYGPTIPTGWTVIDALDFNGNGQPDFLLSHPSARRTAVWYLNGTTLTGGIYGPSLPTGWTLQGAADFNADAQPDYVLSHANTRQTALWYLNGAATVTGSAYGPTLAPGFSLVSP